MLIKKYEIFFRKIKIDESEIIKNKGIRNITCLTSSYRLTLNKINRKIINKDEPNIEPIMITLFDDELYPGYHVFKWNGKNNLGKRVSSGIYFCSLMWKNDITETKKLIYFH